MTIERRYSHRHAVDFKLDVSYRGRRFAPARARDICAEGMSIDLPGVTLPTGTLVELEFKRWGRDWLIAAVVVYHDGGHTIGLMFRRRQDDLLAGEAAAVLHRRPATGPLYTV
jgi:hypothetical protein